MRPRSIGTVALLVALLTLTGCPYDPLPMPRRPRPRPRPPVIEGPTRPLPGPDYQEEASQGDRADQLLRAEIEYLEAAGPGSDGQRLTALRLTSEAWDFAAAGDEREALELLERAVAIDGSSGFAYLYLARLHYRATAYGAAEQFLARARPLLPPDRRLNRALDRFEYDLANRPIADPAIQR